MNMFASLVRVASKHKERSAGATDRVRQAEQLFWSRCPSKTACGQLWYFVQQIALLK